MSQYSVDLKKERQIFGRVFDLVNLWQCCQFLHMVNSDNARGIPVRGDWSPMSRVSVSGHWLGS